MHTLIMFYKQRFISNDFLTSLFMKKIDIQSIQVSIYPKKMDIHVSKYPCIQVCMISKYPIIQVSKKN